MNTKQMRDFMVDCLLGEGKKCWFMCYVNKILCFQNHVVCLLNMKQISKIWFVLPLLKWKILYCHSWAIVNHMELVQTSSINVSTSAFEKLPNHTALY